MMYRLQTLVSISTCAATEWVKDEVRWEQKGSLEKCLSPVTVPIQLAMTFTMPVVREGRLTKGYTTVRTHGHRSPRHRMPICFVT